MADFWPSSGYRLLRKGEDGRLVVTDDFLRTYLMRPELAPIRESGAHELAMHDALMADPRREVTHAGLEAIEDPDARDNYAIFLRFRERLLDAPSLEAAYMALFSGNGIDVPPMFVHHLTQVLLGDGGADGARRGTRNCHRLARPGVAPVRPGTPVDRILENRRDGSIVLGRDHQNGVRALDLHLEAGDALRQWALVVLVVDRQIVDPHEPRLQPRLAQPGNRFRQLAIDRSAAVAAYYDGHLEPGHVHPYPGYDLIPRLDRCPLSAHKNAHR